MSTIIESPVKKYLDKMDKDTDEVRKRILADVESAYMVFNSINELGERNAEFYAGLQWSEQEKEKFAEQFREPYVFNEIKRLVDHLCGVQVQNRMDAKAVPREPGDEAAAQVLSVLIKFNEQINQIEYTEAEVFKIGLIRNCCPTMIRWENEDLQFGYPKLEVIPPNEIVWDINSKKLNLEDCRWFARLYDMTRLEAMTRFPDSDATEMIERATSLQWGNNYYYRVLTKRQQDTYAYRSVATNDERALIGIMEHYEKVIIYKYTVADEIADETWTYDSYDEAKAFYAGLLDTYSAQGTQCFTDRGDPLVAILQNEVPMVYQTIMIGNEIYSRTPMDLTFLPLDVYFPYFDLGDYWGAVSDWISPQVMLNRSYSQLDYQLGASAKSPVSVIESMLKKPWTIETVREQYSRTVPMFNVLNHQAIFQHPNMPINVEYFKEIEFALGRLDTYAGGKNFQGLQENAAESGRAVIARAEQGGLGKLPLYDNLRLWRQSITYKMIWYMKNYMPDGAILRIIGIDDDTDFVEINDEVLNTIREIQVDIVVDEANKSETMKERTFMALKELFAVIQAPPEIALPILTMYAPIPESEKEKIEKMFPIYVQYMQQQQEQNRQQELSQQVQDSLTKKQLKEQQDVAQQLQDATSNVKKMKMQLQTELSDVEAAKQAVQEGMTSPGQLSQAASKLNTPSELSNLQGIMGAGG